MKYDNYSGEVMTVRCWARTTQTLPSSSTTWHWSARIRPGM